MKKIPYRSWNLKKNGIIALASILVFFIFLTLHHVYCHDRLSANLFIGDVKVSWMNQQEFQEVFQKHINEYGPLQLNYKEITTDIAIDKAFFVDQVWKQISDDFTSQHWLTHAWIHISSLFKKTIITQKELEEISLTGFDIDEVYRTYDITPAYEGKLAYTSKGIINEPSSSGFSISDTVLQDRMISALIRKKPFLVDLPLNTVEPYYSPADIDDLQKQLETILETPQVISHAKINRSHTLDPEVFQELVTVSYSFDRHYFILGFDNEKIARIAKIFEPQNPYVTFDEDYYVRIEEAQDGVEIDQEELREVLRHNVNHSGEDRLLLKKGTVSSAEYMASKYEAYGLQHLVSEFTTYHSCCAARVNNIQRIADMLDGYVLAPGEVLNVNEIVGERTLESGFEPAGSIFKGELVDSVGGGISQFITTLHNAVYWGGYEVVTHKPHSIYFSRYPKGVEATINWPYVDYIFKNDTDGYIMVDTEYTDTSITVRILGDNADRVFIGDHRGKTWKNIVRTSPDARQVISLVSEPYNYRDPLVRYMSDPQVPRGEQIVEQEGGQGWSVMVERRVVQKGLLLHEDKKPVHYISEKDTVIRVHPCDNPSEFIPSCYSQ